MIDTVLYASDDFINDHLLSMLGAPDVIGDLRELLDEIADLLDDILGPALNPLRQIGNVINKFATDLVKDALSERFGIDVELIESLLDDPTTRVDIETLDLGPLGTHQRARPRCPRHARRLPRPRVHTIRSSRSRTARCSTPAEFAAYDNTDHARQAAAPRRRPRRRPC